MRTVNVHDAKTNLSSLLQRVEAGEEITIARAGEPVARLVPVPRQNPRTPGLGRGTVTVRDTFFDPLPDNLLRAFEGRPASQSRTPRPRTGRNKK
jgi:prevent-host-death family protein